jgi:NAD(P)H-flavin reductase
MGNPLLFTPVTDETHRHRRTDLTAFEHTYKSEITSIHRLTEHENLYRIQIIDPVEREQFDFKPGQFLMLEIPGIGEAPFSISSSPSRKGDVELCIRNVGTLTNFLAKVERGAHVGLRGPFGTSFPMEEMVGQNILLIAGGLGFAPLRPPIAYVQENRSRFNNVDIIYGTKDPAQLLFTYQYDMWRADDIKLHVTVDNADATWSGRTGLVTRILEELFAKRDEAFFQNTYAIVCGPPVMFQSVCAMLTQKDIPMQKMFVSLERRMHCGMGKCCRCNVGSTYTCLSGPVFDYWSILNLKEAI